MVVGPIYLSSCSPNVMSHSASPAAKSRVCRTKLLKASCNEKQLSAFVVFWVVLDLEVLLGRVADVSTTWSSFTNQTSGNLKAWCCCCNTRARWPLCTMGRMTISCKFKRRAGGFDPHCSLCSKHYQGCGSVASS